MHGGTAELDFTWKGAVKIELPSHFVFTCVTRDEVTPKFTRRFGLLCSAAHVQQIHGMQIIRLNIALTSRVSQQLQDSYALVHLRRQLSLHCI